MSYDNFRPSRFQLLPEVVKNLLIINGLMFVASLVIENTFHIDLQRELGLYYVGSPHFRIYQFVTHLFMHGSFGHILSNMFMLWMFGSVLENYWGGKRFLIYYMVTGLGAALIHSGVVYYEIWNLKHAISIFEASPTPETFTNFVEHYVPGTLQLQYRNIMEAYINDPQNPLALSQAKEYADALVQLKMNIPTIGASGAVFGVLLAFGMLFPNTLLYIYFAIPIKAKYFVIFYGAIELFFGFQNNPADNIAHFAHLGGMLFGFIMIKFWHKKNRNYFY